jgi:hypothetical protein
MTELVVLVPGVGLGGLEMLLLSRRLRSLGYQIRLFSHCPWRSTLSQKAEALQKMICSLDVEVMHFVGHSAGGLIILQLFVQFSVQRPGRIVTLGTPHNGSVIARRLSAVPGGRWLLGRHLASACASGTVPLPVNRETGAIAGRIHSAAGGLLRIPSPNDRLFAVQEIQHPGLTDTTVLPVSHGSMLVSRGVVGQIASFLRKGVFAKAP